MTDSGTMQLVRLSAALAEGDEESLRRVMTGCMDQGEGESVEEVILQSYLFLGYPVALNALALWREVSGREAPPPAEEDWGGWRKRGGEVCETVYGGQYQDLRKNIRALHPDMERWMVVEGYGKVLGRPGLSLKERELCIVAILAVENLPRQLYSHLRGALNAGAGVEEVEGAVSLASSFTEPEVAAAAERIWGQVRDRWTSREDESRRKWPGGRKPEESTPPESGPGS